MSRHRASPTWEERPRNAGALNQLQDTYGFYVDQGRGHRGRPWTKAQALLLGHLYLHAWGCRPLPSRMRPAWCLPSAKTILGLFGSYGAYYEALDETR
jgi:hypothetical protein